MSNKIEYGFENTFLDSDIEMPDGIDIHDAYGIWVDNILVYKVKDRQKSEDENAISDNEWKTRWIRIPLVFD